MDHLVLRHPSYMRGFTFPFSLSVGFPSIWEVDTDMLWIPIFWPSLMATIHLRHQLVAEIQTISTG